MARRRILGRLATWPLAAVLPGAALASTAKLPLKVMMKSAWGSTTPRRPLFPFHMVWRWPRCRSARWSTSSGARGSARVIRPEVGRPSPASRHAVTPRETPEP